MTDVSCSGSEAKVLGSNPSSPPICCVKLVKLLNFSSQFFYLLNVANDNVYILRGCFNSQHNIITVKYLTKCWEKGNTSSIS